MSNQAKLELDGKVYTLPTLTGSENEKAVDVSSLRNTTGYITAYMDRLPFFLFTSLRR